MEIVVKTIGSRTCKYKFTSIKILFSIVLWRIKYNTILSQNWIEPQ